jgi:hypothetical protein
VDRFWQPLAGWIGHAAPFEFKPGYRPAAGISRYLCGTPPVLSLAALECGVDTVLAAEPLGGMAALRAKSLALTRLFAQQVQALHRPRPGAGVARRRCASAAARSAWRAPSGLRRGAGADRPRRDRRLPRRACPTSCASASRRCTCALSTPGTPPSTCARCWTAANGGAPSSTRSRR